MSSIHLTSNAISLGTTDRYTLTSTPTEVQLTTNNDHANLHVNDIILEMDPNVYIPESNVPGLSQRLVDLETRLQALEEKIL